MATRYRYSDSCGRDHGDRFQSEADVFPSHLRGLRRGGAPMLKAGSLVSVVQQTGETRENVCALLEAAGYRVRAFSSAREFLAQMQFPGPSSVVVDFDLPDGGLEIPEALQEAGRSDQVVFISHHACLQSCVRAMRAGAIDFLAAPIARTTLIQAVDCALERSAALRSEYEDRASARFRIASLTRREFSVLKLLLEGIPNKDIGARLGIAEGTIKIHRRNVMEKVRAKSLVDIVLLAQRSGIPFPEAEFTYVSREQTMQVQKK